MPKISVIMPVYNGEKYLREAIDSILNQTYADFEFIIINDCSTDSTEEIIKSYKDERIVYIKNEKNLGVANTLNRGLDIAKGEYIARMDADDISLPERFEKQLSFMNDNLEAAVCGAWIEFIDGKKGIFKNIPQHNNAKIDLLFASCIAHPTAFIRKSILNDLRYDSEFEGLEDYALWYKLTKKGQIANISKILLKYRIHENQVTKNYSNIYISRSRKLKEVILNDLQIDYTEQELNAYTAYSINEIDYNEYLIPLTTLLDKIYIKAPKDYDLKKMKKVFQSVILNGYYNQNKITIENLLKNIILMNKMDFFLFEMKKKIRNLLKK